jgi:hypothetical protein
MAESPKIEKPSVRSISTENVLKVAAPAISGTLVSSEDPTAKHKTEVAAEIRPQTSTGPRTAEGKERAKHNATKHGLFVDIVLAGEPFRESLRDYTALLEGLREDIQPVGALEEVLVEQLAFEFLRLGRLYKADAQTTPRVFNRLEENLRKSERMYCSGDDEQAEGFAARASELLLRYGNTVSNQIHRIMDRLERLQEIRGGRPAAPRIDVHLS